MARTKDGTSEATGAKSNEDRLMDAAFRCIRRFGVAKSFMDDIAREAGLSRSTTYRVFQTRKELLEKVAARCVATMRDKMIPRMEEYQSFEEALIHGIIESMRLAKRDRVMIATMQAMGDHGLERYLINTKGPVFAYLTDVWSSTLARARAAGEVRHGLSDHDVAFWITAVECILLLKDDLQNGDEEALIRKFLVPALVTLQPSAESARTGTSTTTPRS